MGLLVSNHQNQSFILLMNIKMPTVVSREQVPPVRKSHLFSHVLDLNNIQNYLQHTLDRNVTRDITSDITKFRLSAHCLNIERGRYIKPKTPISNRICPHCTLIETEDHIFMKCQRYIQPRNKLYEAFEICITNSYANYASPVQPQKIEVSHFVFIKLSNQPYSTRVQICTSLRSYANKSCPYVPRFDLKFNTRYIVLWNNSMCLNALGDSDPLSLRVMSVRDTSIAGCRVETLIFHSYTSQKSIILIQLDIKTFMIAFQSMNCLVPTKLSHPHTLAAS